MISKNFFAILLCALVQNTWSRYIGLSLNMSVSLYDGQRQAPSLSVATVRSCMKETDISMIELRRFRLSLLAKGTDVLNTIEEGDSDHGAHIDDLDVDSDEGLVEGSDDSVMMTGTEINGIMNDDYLAPKSKGMEYDAATAGFKVNDKHGMALQCFAYCLYEHLGLVSKGVYMSQHLFSKLYSAMATDRHLVKECMNLNANNKCESAYKMHLCYERLNTLEEERRLQKYLVKSLPARDLEEEKSQLKATITADPDSNESTPQRNEINWN